MDLTPPPADEFIRRREHLLKAWDGVGVFDRQYPRPFLVPRSRRFRWGGAAGHFGDRRRKHLVVSVPEDSFRRLFADIFVGHSFKTVRPLSRRRTSTISRRFERILRAAAQFEPERNERARRWQEEAREILREREEWRRTLSPPVMDGSDDDLLLRAFGAYLILAERESCTREEFLSEGSRRRPGMFRKMVDAAGVPFAARKPGALAKRIVRVGGDTRAIERADAHIKAFFPELQPWRISFGRRPEGWDRRLLPPPLDTPTA